MIWWLIRSACVSENESVVSNSSCALLYDLPRMTSGAAHNSVVIGLTVFIVLSALEVPKSVIFSVADSFFAVKRMLAGLRSRCTLDSAG